MTVLGILGVWNLFMMRQFIPVYTVVYAAPCLKLPALILVNEFSILIHNSVSFVPWAHLTISDTLVQVMA